MGSYCELYVGNLRVESEKNGVSTEIMSLFQESDRATFMRPLSVRRGRGWSRFPDEDENEDDDELEEAHVYCCTAAQAIDRLNIRGYTLKKSQDGFNAYITEQRANAHQFPYFSIPEEYTFENWSAVVSALIERNANLPSWTSDSVTAELEASPLRSRSLLFGESDVSEILDYMDPFRALLALVHPATVIELDITDLVNGGWVGEDELLCAANGKHIILTEGASDVQILQTTLRLLYPHLIDLFHFMDFGISNLQGGVGTLSNIVRAFIGSSITNPIIAMFDNDTAGSEAIVSLNSVDLPPNIRLVSLPDLSIAKSYPTFGPEGMRQLDINGKACSIELYFGEDVLAQEDGSLTPIQWTSFIKSMKQYQGEILDKKRLQEKYQQKLRSAQADPENMKQMDWGGMHAILQTMFAAFMD